jgi:ADP-heptose:LPS heptosyltransferase
MKIRVVRESGGLGDIISAMPVFPGLRKKHPAAIVHGFFPAYYHPLVERGECVDKLWPTPWGEGRRGRLAPMDEAQWPYLKGDGDYDLTVDLYCPGFRWEIERKGRMWHNRDEANCQAAGVPVSCPRITLTQAERDAGRARLEQAAGPGHRAYVALQPFSTDPRRAWPSQSWAQLAERLAADGLGAIMLDIRADRLRAFPSIPQLIALPLIELAAAISQCQLLIGPDSGLFHLAACVDTPALITCASTMGALLTRTYPRQSYVQPPPVEGDCPWPCYWTGLPPECNRQTMIERGVTCRAQERILVEDVHRTALRMLEVGGGPRSIPAPMFPSPSAADLCAALPHLPYAASVVDVAGCLGEFVAARNLRIESPLIRADLIPVPVFERTQDAAVLLRVPEGQRAEEWIFELFRCLKVGGLLLTHRALSPCLAEHGFSVTPLAGDLLLGRKQTTWPQPLAAVAPPIRFVSKPVPLPRVTLICCEWINHRLAEIVLASALKEIAPAKCVLVTDRQMQIPGVEVLIRSAPPSQAAYSAFYWRDVSALFSTSHVLLVQWDAGVLDGRAWRGEFLRYDLVGPKWRFDTRRQGQVGSGGFTLRSRKLYDALQHYPPRHPEDHHICRIIRPDLETKYGILFAPPEVADRFGFEEIRVGTSQFGFHAMGNWPQALGESEIVTRIPNVADMMTGRKHIADLYAECVRLKMPSAADAVLRRAVLVERGQALLDLLQRHYAALHPAAFAQIEKLRAEK